MIVPKDALNQGNVENENEKNNFFMKIDAKVTMSQP